MFLGIKALTAPLNLSIFLLIAARLPKPEFALYAWLIAFGQFSEWVSYLGVNWIAVHYIPDYRVRVGGDPYRRFVLGLVGIRLAAIAGVVGMYFVFAPQLVAAFGPDTWLHPLRLYLIVMVADLAVPFLRLSIFEPLLEQGKAQGNVLLQHVVFLGSLLVLSTPTSSLSIERVIWARGAGAWSAWVFGLVQLMRLLQKPVPATVGERPPGARFLLGFALNNYAQDLMRLMSGAPMVTLLASRLVGVSALAMFGFASQAIAFVARAQPTQLFLGLLRPRFIAEYIGDASFGRLRGSIALLLKVSMTGVAVIAAVLLAVGRDALDLLSDGKYSASYGLLLVFLVWLAFSSVSSMQAVLTNVLGHSSFLRRASVASLLVVPAAIALVFAGAGAYGLVLAMVLGETVSLWMVTNQLWRKGYRFPFDVHGYLRITGAALAATLAGGATVQVLPGGLWSVGGGTAATLGIFALALRVLRPFVLEERTAIETLVGRRVVML